MPFKITLHNRKVNVLQYPHIMKTTVRVIFMTIGWVIFGVCVVCFIFGVVYYCMSMDMAFKDDGVDADER